jgi:hypothetical protein
VLHFLHRFVRKYADFLVFVGGFWLLVLPIVYEIGISTAYFNLHHGAAMPTFYANAIDGLKYSFHDHPTEFRIGRQVIESIGAVLMLFAGCRAIYRLSVVYVSGRRGKLSACGK